MKMLRKKSLMVSVSVFSTLSLIGPMAALAATATSLGDAASFSILGASAMSSANTTTVSGNLGLSPGLAGSRTGTWVVSGLEYFGTGGLSASAQTAALGAYNNLVAQTSSGVWSTNPNGINSPLPGVWTETGSPAYSGTLTLTGSATDVWVFKISTDFTFSGSVVLAGNAQACNVFWSVSGDTTLASGSNFVGTLIGQNDITSASGSTINGRLISLSGTTIAMNGTNSSISGPTCVTAAASGGGGSTPVPPEPPTLTVIKHVINDNGGTAVASDASVSVKIYGKDVAGSPSYGQESGKIYQLAETGTTTVSELPMVGYTSSFSGDCNSIGEVHMEYGDRKTCTITNNDISLVPPLINITKIPTPLSLPGGAGSVTYDYLVSNLGVVGMFNVKVTDDKCSNMMYLSGDTNGNSRLGVNETWSYRCTTNVATTTTNTVTATGDANGFTAIDLASATVVVGAPLNPPLIHVVKWPSTFTLPIGGGDVTYYYFVTNPGTEPLNNVSITDNKCDGLPGRVIGTPGDLNKNNLLESNETWNFTCKTKLTQTTTNIGTATGYANGFSAVDLSPATVVVASPKLPNTGIPPNDNNLVWYVVLGAGLLSAASASIVAAMKKRTA